MKTAFYYLRSYMNHPYACVCLVQTDDGRIVRGISLCSPKDTFSKRIGRNKAYGYALKGLKDNSPIFKRSIFSSLVVNSILNRDDTNSEYYSTSVYPQSMELDPYKGYTGESVNGGYVPLTKFEAGILEI